MHQSLKAPHPSPQKDCQKKNTQSWALHLVEKKEECRDTAHAMHAGNEQGTPPPLCGLTEDLWSLLEQKDRNQWE